MAASTRHPSRTAADERRCLCVLAALVLSLVASPSPGQAESTCPLPADPQETIELLLNRIEELEARVARLEGRQAPALAAAAQESHGSAGASTADARESAAYPQLHFRGYADVSFRASDEAGGTRSFALGQTDLFLTSQLSDRLRVLGEVVLESDEDNVPVVDLERLLVRYAPSRFFDVGLGRYHTAIGYYNTAYHHGTWFQTATGRPFVFAFEDEGGILPVHNVGLTATGSIPSGRLGLRYVIEVGNGRASRSPRDEPVQGARDENRGKAVNLAVRARPESVPGLELGVSLYRDRLTPEASPALAETIVAGYVVHQTLDLEWLNEALVIRRAPRGSEERFNTWSFYTQISRQLGSFRPYFRYQYLNAPRNEPILGGLGRRSGPAIGIRYNIGDLAGLKLQYDRTGSSRARATDDLTFQAAFAF